MPTRQGELALKAIEGGVRSWDELRALTKLNEEQLGFALAELFDLRKIWTREKNGVRVYGKEQRTGLVPHFPPPRRRMTDQA